MIRLRTLKRLLQIRRLRPAIVISEYGRLTENNHKVSVSFASKGGACGALTFDADPAGHAKASSYAKTYAHITGLPVVDQRENAEARFGRMPS